MKQIPLTRGMVALVDDEDYERLSQHKWTALVLPGGLVYAYRMAPRPSRKAVYMHKEILDSVRVDHRDRDGLNNQRLNLRPCTRTGNAANSRKERGKVTSQFKGVSYCPERNNWMARVIVNGKTIHLGRFQKEQDAALAYNEAAADKFGEFARLNQVAA